MNGVQSKPRWTSLLALALLLNTAAMPVQVMLLFGHPPSEWHAIWAKLTDHNRLVMLLSPVAAGGVWLVCRWGWWTAMALLSAGLVNNLFLLPYDTMVPRSAVLASSALILFVGGWLLLPATQHLFCERALQWWKTPHRYRAEFAVDLCRSGGKPTPHRLVNISRSGMRIAETGQKLPLGRTVDATIRFDQRVIHCVARVVRHAAECAQAPAGYGLQFQELRAADRLWLSTRLGRFCITRESRVPEGPLGDLESRTRRLPDADPHGQEQTRPRQEVHAPSP